MHPITLIDGYSRYQKRESPIYARFLSRTVTIFGQNGLPASSNQAKRADKRFQGYIYND